MREVLNSDINAAYRGLGMNKMEKAELEELIKFHSQKPDMFASCVIVNAAQQALTLLRVFEATRNDY